MTTRLTKKILRTAADLLSPTYRDVNFMCHAVHAAVAGDALWRSCDTKADRADRAEAAFHDLLTLHGVDAGGHLVHQGISYQQHLSAEEAQALRFDFLNLLAESL